jgi:hypothetical protein
MSRSLHRHSRGRHNVAQVPTIRTWEDARPYLENLKGTVLADVRPLLDVPGAAPFAVCREVLCYIDHLGHLYSGRGQVGERFKDYLGSPGIAVVTAPKPRRTPSKSLKKLGRVFDNVQISRQFRESHYLKQMMSLSQIDPNYGTRVEEIYQIYRNGPVHEFEPKVLENRKGQLLQWLCYKGARSDNIEISGKSLTLTHLEPVSPAGDKLFWLPVSTVCLIMDLLSSIDEFQKAGPEDERVTAWNRAARQLTCPKPFDFVVK